MLASSDIISLLEQNPNGLTSQEVTQLIDGAKESTVSGRLSKLHAYGQISKQRIENARQVGHGKSRWFAKRAPT